jgi:hypothetical protein
VFLNFIEFRIGDSVGLRGNGSIRNDNIDLGNALLFE